MLVTTLYCKEKLLIDHFWECNQFWEFGIGSANNHLFGILLYSHYFYAWYCIDIVRRKFSLDHSWELTYCWGKMMCWSIIYNIHIHLHSLTCSPEKNSFKKECNQKCWKKMRSSLKWCFSKLQQLQMWNLDLVFSNSAKIPWKISLIVIQLKTVNYDQMTNFVGGFWCR